MSTITMSRAMLEEWADALGCRRRASAERFGTDEVENAMLAVLSKQAEEERREQDRD